MITIEGKSVFGGVSIGKLMFYKRNEKVIRRTHVDDVDAEWKRFEEAKNTAIDQLKDLYDKAIEDVGEANAMIFEIHQMMLDDLDYLESIEGIIRTQNVNAEYAVSTTADNFAQMFASMDDAYMQGRAADVKDVSERVLDILCGVSNGTREMTEPCIVAADDLAPSETVQLDKEKVLGFATMYGSSNSHTAILARTMNIPAVIGMGEALNPKYDGEMAIIDGFTGTLYVDPDEETLAELNGELSLTDMISVEGVSESFTSDTINLADYLKENYKDKLKVKSGTASTLSVRVIMEKMGTKKIDIPLSAITIKGRPTDLDMVLTPADKITVEVAAVDGSLDNIDQNDVKAVLDLTSYQKEGRHEVPVQITLPDGYELTSEVKIVVNLTKKQRTSGSNTVISAAGE